MGSSQNWALRYSCVKVGDVSDKSRVSLTLTVTDSDAERPLHLSSVLNLAGFPSGHLPANLPAHMFKSMNRRSFVWEEHDVVVGTKPGAAWLAKQIVDFATAQPADGPKPTGRIGRWVYASRWSRYATGGCVWGSRLQWLLKDSRGLDEIHRCSDRLALAKRYGLSQGVWIFPVRTTSISSPDLKSGMTASTVVTRLVEAVLGGRLAASIKIRRESEDGSAFRVGVVCPDASNREACLSVVEDLLDVLDFVRMSTTSSPEREDMLCQKKTIPCRLEMDMVLEKHRGPLGLKPIFMSDEIGQASIRSFFSPALTRKRARGPEDATVACNKHASERRRKR